MARTTRTEPSLTEWVALGVLCEQPAHGWEVARQLGPEGEIGQVWQVGRALVYRAISVLREQGFVSDRGSEASTRGPQRLLIAPTARGRQALRRWLDRPVEHVRDLRSELLLKLLLLERAGVDRGPLLRDQLFVLGESERGLAEKVSAVTGFERTLAVWRLTSARAARAFVEALLDERVGEPVNYEAIGFVRSPHAALGGMPLQPQADVSGPSRIEITEPHRGCLADVGGFSHVWVLAHLHESIGWAATVDPFLGDEPRGTFATRSPHRPNPISLSLCRLTSVEPDALVVEGLDLLDGTPVLDVKPYVPLFDTPAPPVRTGWFEGRAERVFERVSDDRFERRSTGSSGR